jgi:hypothetical protein
LYFFPLPQGQGSLRPILGSGLVTVHDEVVAKLRAVQLEPEPGAAAKQLHQFMKRLPKPRGPKTHVSSHVKGHLYGNGVGLQA